MNKIKCIVLTCVFAVFIFSVSAACCLSPAQQYSNSERRELASLPDANLQTISSGEFMDGFEKYSADQFPLREKLRSLKAMFSTKLLNKLDNNGLFTAGGHISKIDEKQNEYMMNYSSELFAKIVNQYMTDKNVKLYFSIVPDKNFILAPKYGYPSLNYNEFIEEMKNRTEFMHYVDVTSMLSLEDYYTTDTHWRQENITDIAQFLAEKMGSKIPDTNYTVNTLDNPFYGVYAGQFAMKTKPDTIKYLTNSVMDKFTVTYYDTGAPEVRDMYNMEKAYGKDPYEMFLSGVAPLITIENPSAETDKELVLFRDSFGSSIAPLLAQGYSKVTVVDIRYIQSSFLGNFVDFENCDVLFLYSTALLNNSLAMK